MGADAQVAPGVRFGLTGGYSRSTFNVDARSSTGSADNYSIGAYGGSQWGAVGLRLGAAYTWSQMSVDRSVVFPGFAEQLSSNYGAGTAQLFGELGYRFGAAPWTQGVSFEPFVGLAYVNVATNGFNESPGSASLYVQGGSSAVTFSTLGARLASVFSFAGQDVTASGMAGWRHAFGDVNPESTLAFLGSSPFTVSGVPVGEDVAVLEATLGASLSRLVLASISYAGQFGSGFQDQSVRGNLVAHF